MSPTSTAYCSFVPLCPILIWVILVGFFLSVCFAVQDGIDRLKRLHQVPCSRCAFFTGDYRLKCTVHPCKALSEDAIDCLDYEPQTELQPVQLLTKSSKKHLAPFPNFIPKGQL